MFLISVAVVGDWSARQELVVELIIEPGTFLQRNRKPIPSTETVKFLTVLQFAPDTSKAIDHSRTKLTLGSLVFLYLARRGIFCGRVRVHPVSTTFRCSCGTTIFSCHPFSRPFFPQPSSSRTRRPTSPCILSGRLVSSVFEEPSTLLSISLAIFISPTRHGSSPCYEVWGVL